MVHILKLEDKGDFPLFFVKITRRQGVWKMAKSPNFQHSMLAS